MFTNIEQKGLLYERGNDNYYDILQLNNDMVRANILSLIREGDRNNIILPDYFDDFSNIAAIEIGDIVAVNASILTVSDTEVASSPQTISYNRKTLVMPDNRLRKVFNTTVILRNRLN